MKRRHIDIYNNDATFIPSNLCLYYRSPRGDLFRYHHCNQNDLTRIFLFSRLVEDIEYKRYEAQNCPFCKKHIFQPKEKDTTEKVRDEEAVRLVNETLRNR